MPIKVLDFDAKNRRGSSTLKLCIAYTVRTSLESSVRMSLWNSKIMISLKRWHIGFFLLYLPSSYFAPHLLLLLFCYHHHHRQTWYHGKFSIIAIEWSVKLCLSMAATSNFIYVAQVKANTLTYVHPHIHWIRSFIHLMRNGKRCWKWQTNLQILT